MAKRRTKKDRLRSKTKTQEVKQPAQKQQPQVLEPAWSTSKPEEKKKIQVANFFSQDPQLIRSDLKKTLTITIFILLVLFTIALLYT